MAEVAQDPGELFDLYAEDGTPLGRTKARALVHRDGDWHRSVHIWVVLGGEGGHELLFQRRSLGKDTSPGAIDVAVAGHLRAGESVTDALREAREEVGIDLGPGDVIWLGVRRRADEHVPGVLDRELQEIFVAVVTLPLEAFRPDPAEVDGLLALPFEAAGALFRGEVETAAGRLLTGSGAVEAGWAVALRDFVRAEDGYYARTYASIAGLLLSPPDIPVGPAGSQ